MLFRSDHNFNSYAPTLTGTGASGSWGISVTGSSASCTGNAATATNVAWSGITSKPTTLSGFGITDALDTSATAQTKSGNLTISGSSTLSGGLTVSGSTYYTFNKPTTASYQTVALFGSTSGGIFITTDSPIVGSGAYYNNGWLASAASGSQIVFNSGAVSFDTFSGATVGAAPSFSTKMSLSNAGALNVVGAITQNGNQVLHAGNYSSYALPLTGGVVSGNITIASTSPVLILKDTDSTGAAQTGYVSLFDSSNTERGWMGYGSSINTDLTINNSQGDVVLSASGSAKVGTSVILHAGNYGAYSTFTGVTTSQSATQPTFQLYRTGNGANEKLAEWLMFDSTFRGRFVNDAYSAATEFMTVTRSGTSVGTVSFPNGAVSIGGTLYAPTAALTSASSSVGYQPSISEYGGPVTYLEKIGRAHV